MQTEDHFKGKAGSVTTDIAYTRKGGFKIAGIELIPPRLSRQGRIVLVCTLLLAINTFFGFGPTCVQAAPRAFYGAEGSGASAQGGRGGAVIQVTNLNDSGTGSLRTCATASGPRTCIFRVGGTISVLSPIVITNPYLTIAGQTAPGGGILIRGKLLRGKADAAISIRTHNVIIRYIRVRIGSVNVDDQHGSALFIRGNSGVNVRDIIIDHVSLSWGNDETFALWSQGAYIRNVTLSWSIMAEGLRPHSKGGIVGSHVSEARLNMTGIDIHHNFFTSNDARNPYLGVKTQSVVNNIVYNWGSEAGIMARGGLIIDIIGNLTKPGPSSDNGSNPNDIVWFPYSSTTCQLSLYCIVGNPSIYIQENAGYVNKSVSDPNTDNWRMVEGWSSESGTFSVSASYRRQTPLPTPDFPIRLYSSINLPSVLLPTVGAFQRLACDGTWVAARDAVDVRLVKNYHAGIGTIISSEGAVGGFPVIGGGTPCADTDHDGMSDIWESTNGLDLRNAADRNGNSDLDGYTDLEEFLNGTNPHAADS